MKVCHVTDYHPSCHKRFGGAEQAVERIVGLESKKLDCVIATSSFKGSHRDIFGFHTLEDYFGIFGALFKSIIPFDPAVYFKVKRFFKKYRPNIVHLHKFDHLSFAVSYAAKKLNIPVVHSIYDYVSLCPTSMLLTLDNKVCGHYRSIACFKCVRKRKAGFIRGLFLPLTNLLFRSFFSQIDRFIVLSDSSKDILSRFGVSVSVIDIVHLPFDVPKLSIVKIDKPLILYAGWVEPHKGLDILVRAMGLVLKKVPDARLYVAGSHDSNPLYYQKVRSLIQKLGLGQCVSILGKKDPSEIKGLLKESAVVVIPEQWENMSPLFLIESMSYGKPIVASDIGGFPEFIDDGRNGFLVGPRDYSKFAEKIVSFLEDPDKARSFGLAAKQKFLKTFNNAHILTSLINVYDLTVKNEK